MTRVSRPDSRTPLRIALATDWFLPRLGGIELHLSDLASRLVAEGNAVSVLTSTPDAVAPPGVTLVPLDVARLPAADVAASAGLPASLRRALTEGNFDVVHAHASVVSPVAFAAVAAARTLGLPAVLTFHSMLHAGTLLLSAADWLTGWTRWPVVLSAVSGTVARQVERTTRGLAVQVLPNGIDLGPWQAARAAARRSSLPPTFVCTMRLQRKKRPSALLHAFARARSLAPAAPARLVIIGEGPQRGMLERYAQRLGLADHVRFTGWLPREEVAEQYASADVFMSATKHESFGIAALEARAAGLPVIAMRASGATEFLRHDVNALLASDDAALARQVALLATDPALRQRLGQHTGDVEPFEWDAVLRRHRDAYDSAIRLSLRHAP